MSPNKKPAAKKTAARRKPKPAAPWDTYWVRTVAGEEFVARAKHTRDGVFLQDPTMMTYTGSTMMLSPYAVVTDDPTVFFAAGHVLHSNPAGAPIVQLYEASLKLKDVVRAGYLATMERSLRAVTDALRPSPEPTDEDLRAIEEAAPVKVSTRTREQSIDDLVKLAEAAGKGKNPGG